MNDDDDEMLFVRGASPSKKDVSNSPLSRRSHERDNYYDSDNASDDRSERRHRERNRRSLTPPTQKRTQSSKNDHSNDSNNSRNNNSSSSNRGHERNDNRNDNRNNNRNDSRNNSNRRNQIDLLQDPESICVYFMKSKCQRGDDCAFSHNALPLHKMELCKFYLMDCCAKRDKCLYMHHDFPSKFFCASLDCVAGKNYKFLHEPLDDQLKKISLKHLETALKEILGDFPRPSHEAFPTPASIELKNGKDDNNDNNEHLKSPKSLSKTINNNNNDNNKRT
ncbi:hypothetical protein HCN44_010918 [Aphidius gifuensis]|uniref:C3H1-type domain-containing protein n=1 Tax=Aphidius gifuensis TaxID=684658 RepID=A0A835CZC0_APHGI|nr:hypothetical protein HCN44_010918 [Aphidius gifuensis]